MAASALHSSETYEHLTPIHIVEAMHEVLGEVELDPASSKFANKTIKAKRIYTQEDNGLIKPWRAKTLFLNPPGGVYDVLHDVPVFRATKKRKPCTETGACGLEPGHKHHLDDVVSSAAVWWAKLTDTVEKGNVEHAIFLGFSLELLATAQRFDTLQPLDYLFCIPEERLKFDIADGRQRVKGDQPTHSNIIVHLWNEKANPKFVEVFSRFGYTR